MPQTISSPSEPLSKSTFKQSLRQKKGKKSQQRELGHESFSHILSQACVLHASSVLPSHPLPPFLGSGLVQVLVRIPPPHVLEQWPKAEKPPCTATNTNEAVWVHEWVSALTIERVFATKQVRQQSTNYNTSHLHQANCSIYLQTY